MSKNGQTSWSRSIRVELGERSYPIRLGTGILDSAGVAILEATKAKRALVITDTNVGRRYAARLIESIEKTGVRARRITVPAGDKTKNLAQVEQLYGKLIDFGADRGTVVVALGGGMVGDLAGFLAATYLRGIAFVQVPTTILAMVDASIGGKVGVNLSQGKNLVGAFHQPKLVWIDVETLKTLPRRERAAGLAEVVKAAVIWDARFFRRLETEIELAWELDPQVLIPTLARACAIKAEVVERDERESDLRMLLNFGHTLAHSVETLQGYRGALHGEAVAMGMVFAARRSETLGLCPTGVAQRIESMLGRIELPTVLPDFPRRAYLDVLGVDKKKRDERIQFVVLRAIGKAETVPLRVTEIYPAR